MADDDAFDEDVNAKTVHPPASPVPPVAKPHVVLLVHGIRDFALWQETVGRSLSEDGFHVEFTNYGRFDLFRFLIPIRYFRRKAIEEVLKQIRIAKKTNDADDISIIAHSFGTYVVSHILQENFDLRFRRIVFCGSVVRYGFPFEQFYQRFNPPILNEVGTRDIWPAVAESVTWGYGSAGTYGFRRPLVKDRWHNGAGHGFFLEPDFCRKFWVPYLSDGDVVAASRDPEKPRLWIQLLSIFRLKYVLLALCALAVVSSIWGWPRQLNQWLPGHVTPSPATTFPLSASLSLAPDESPYLSRKLTAPVAPIAQRYKQPPDYPFGYYLWPELDFDILLFTFRAGEDSDPPIYVTKSEFFDEPDEAKRRKRARIWSAFETLGRSLRPALARTDETGQTLRELVPAPPADDGQLGIAFLRHVYPAAGADSATRVKEEMGKAIFLADRLLQKDTASLSQDEHLNEAARLLATRRVQPVLNLSIVNFGLTQVVTAVHLEVLEVVGAFSALESGPLLPIDTVKFDLGPKPGTMTRTLTAPVKIAANDAVAIRVALRSKFMFGYLCRLTLLSGDKAIGRSEDFLVDFGFQPQGGN